MINGIKRSYWLLLIFWVSCKTTQNNATLAVTESQNNDKSPEITEEIYNPTPQKRFDLIHTNLDLSFNWEERQVLGKATITFSPHFYPMDFIIFDAKYFDIKSIEMNGKALNYDYNDEELVIDLGKEYERKDTLSIRIDYIANPYFDLRADQEATTYNRGIYFIDHSDIHPNKPRQIWTYGPTEYNSYWFPTIDEPNIRCKQEIKLTVNKKYVTVSNGILKSRTYHSDSLKTDHWILSKTHSPFLFTFIVGNFSKIEEDQSDFPVSYLFEPGYESSSDQAFGNTMEMITFFSEVLGHPFPWPKYDQVVVRDFFPGEMGTSSLSLYMEEIQDSGGSSNALEWEEVISKNTFRQWFGCQVTHESWANISAVEALGSYGDFLWSEYKYGKEELELKLINALDEYLFDASIEPLRLVNTDFEDTEEFMDKYSYAKGIRVIHMLRNYVGDEAFFQSLNLFLSRHKFRSVEVHDLRLAFEEVTGEDLNWFFNQWFYSKGHPELRINHSYSSDTLFIYVEQLQDLSDKIPLYQLPVYMDLFYDSATYRYPLLIQNQKHKFKLPLSEIPKAIIVDGDYQILGVIDHNKSNEELLSQYKLGDSFSARYESLVKLLNSTTGQQWNEAVRLGCKDHSGHLRLLTLEMLLGLDKDQLENFNDEIQILTKDSSQKVRSVAFELLTQLKPSSEFWLANLNDSSLLVKGIILDYLLSNDIKSDSLVTEYSESKNIEILIPISFHINRKFKMGFNQWYITKMKFLNKSDIYYLMQSYKDYIKDAPYKEKSEAVPVLCEVAKNHINYMVRYSAYEGLKSLRGVDNVENKIVEIEHMERDPRLIKIYSGQ